MEANEKGEGRSGKGAGVKSEESALARLQFRLEGRGWERSQSSTEGLSGRRGGGGTRVHARLSVWPARR